MCYVSFYLFLTLAMRYNTSSRCVFHFCRSRESLYAVSPLRVDTIYGSSSDKVLLKLKFGWISQVLQRESPSKSCPSLIHSYIYMQSRSCRIAIAVLTLALRSYPVTSPNQGVIDAPGGPGVDLLTQPVSAFDHPYSAISSPKLRRKPTLNCPSSYLCGVWSGQPAHREGHGRVPFTRFPLKT